jgi:hypothetical protein
MKTGEIIHNSMFVAALFLAGCATNLTERSAAPNSLGKAQLVSQEQARQLTAQYRRYASDLREQAERTEWEARWYAGQFGADDREAIRHRAQAQQLWAAAEEVDQLARDYRRQVPHGQMN